MLQLATVILALVALTAFAAHAAEGKPLMHVKTSQPLVALTFDDGPSPGNDRYYIELFAKEGVKATFFVTGKSAEKHPEVLAELVAAGHEIGNHTWGHPHMSKLSDDEQREQVDKLDALLQKTAGKPCALYRAPFLEYSPQSWALIAEHGYTAVNASVGTRDWDKKVSADDIIAKLAKAKAGDVVLMHSWPGTTRAAMPTILADLKARGLRCVTVSELLAAADQ